MTLLPSYSCAKLGCATYLSPIEVGCSEDAAKTGAPGSCPYCSRPATAQQRRPLLLVERSQKQQFFVVALDRAAFLLAARMWHVAAFNMAATVVHLPSIAEVRFSVRWQDVAIKSDIAASAWLPSAQFSPVFAEVYVTEGALSAGVPLVSFTCDTPLSSVPLKTVPVALSALVHAVEKGVYA